MSSYSWSIAGNGTISGSTTSQSVTVDAGDCTSDSFTLTLTITNSSGCSSTCSKTVSIEDTVDPTITAPLDVSVNNDPGECYATGVSLGTPTTGDNCSVASVTNNAPTQFPVGTTTVTWTVTDLCGNSATATQLVTVTDNENPTISCPADLTVNAVSSCQYTLADFTGAAAAADNCGSVTVSQSPAPGTSLGLGTHTITLTATDGAGNSASCTFNVTVEDTTNPVIDDCGPSQSASADSSCQAMVPDFTGAVVASDCNGPLSITQSPTAGTSVGVGTHTITITVTDAANNSSTCTTSFVVTDDEDPTITCPPDQTVNSDPGECEATVSVGTPATGDNCGVDTVEGVRSDSRALTDPYPVGTTTITWTVTDIHGNTAECTQTIIVKGTPLLDPINDQCVEYSDCLTVDIGAFDCDDSGSALSYTATGLPANLTLTDNGNGTATISGQADVPAGIYPVTVTVTDSDGLTHSLTFNIEVKKEKADIEFNNADTDTFVYTAGPSISTAPVRITVNLTPEDDSTDCCTGDCTGDITKAKVRLEFFKSGNMTSTPNMVVTNLPVNSSGVMSTMVTLSVDTWRVVAKVEPGNTYWRSLCEEICVTVDYGSNDKRVTGGGWIPLAMSANGKANFGFTVNYQRNGTPKGNSMYMIRGTDGYNYLVKSSSWNGGGLTFYSDPTKASFSGRCVIQKIDRTTGLVVDSIGNCRLTVNIRDGDRANPRQPDEYAITAWLPDNTLWHQAGTAAAPIQLGSGNVTIHNSSNSR